MKVGSCFSMDSAFRWRARRHRAARLVSRTAVRVEEESAAAPVRSGCGVGWAHAFCPIDRAPRTRGIASATPRAMTRPMCPWRGAVIRAETNESHQRSILEGARSDTRNPIESFHDPPGLGAEPSGRLLLRTSDSTGIASACSSVPSCRRTGWAPRRRHYGRAHSQSRPSALKARPRLR